MDLEHFIDSFRARRSNHDPSELVDRLPTADSVVNVLDFCSILISILSHIYHKNIDFSSHLKSFRTAPP